VCQRAWPEVGDDALPAELVLRDQPRGGACLERADADEPLPLLRALPSGLPRPPRLPLRRFLPSSASAGPASNALVAGDGGGRSGTAGRAWCGSR
jgi:hypothetical protein